MYSQSDLNDAVEGGAISAEQANSLRSFIAARNGAPTADEEHFRFLTGFNDFLCFAACLFILIAVGWLGTLIPMGGPMSRGIPFASPFAALFIGAASWGLAEIFTKRRHQWLTSILLIVGATWGVALFLLLLLLPSLRDPTSASLVGALSLLLGGGAAVLHWKRYRFPIAIATIYGFGLLAIIALIATSMRGMDSMMIIFLIGGIGAFLFAMWWDGQDPARHNEKSEAAFWLHWLGAGLIVNGLATLFGVNQGIWSAGGAIGVIAIFLVLAVIGLAVNRRAYALTAVSPLIIAIQTLIGGSSRRSYGGYDYDRYGSYSGSYSPYGSTYSPYGSYSGRSYASAEGTMLSLLIIGVILLLLAIYWAPMRRVLVGMLPAGLRARLSPTGAEATEQAQTFE